MNEATIKIYDGFFKMIDIVIAENKKDSNISEENKHYLIQGFRDC